MNPSTLVATWNPRWRMSSSLATCHSGPTTVLMALEGELPVLVYVYPTSREGIVRVRCVNVAADLEPEGLVSTEDARTFYVKLIANGFKRLK